MEQLTFTPTLNPVVSVRWMLEECRRVVWTPS